MSIEHSMSIHGRVRENQNRNQKPLLIYNVVNWRSSLLEQIIWKTLVMFFVNGSTKYLNQNNLITTQSAEEKQN